MPTEWTLHVLEERLRRDFGEVFEIETADLYELAPLEQSATLDGMIEMQGDFPIVLVNGSAVCVSAIDVEAIAAGVDTALHGDSNKQRG